MSNKSKLFTEELARRNPDWEKIVAVHNDALAAEREKAFKAGRLEGVFMSPDEGEISYVRKLASIIKGLKEQLDAEREKVENQQAIIHSQSQLISGSTHKQLEKQLAAEREVGHNQAVTLGQHIARLEDQLAALTAAAKAYHAESRLDAGADFSLDETLTAALEKVTKSIKK